MCYIYWYICFDDIGVLIQMRVGHGARTAFLSHCLYTMMKNYDVDESRFVITKSSDHCDYRELDVELSSCCKSCFRLGVDVNCVVFYSILATMLNTRIEGR